MESTTSDDTQRGLEPKSVAVAGPRSIANQPVNGILPGRQLIPHILVVEDDEAAGAQLETVYRHANYQVTVVHCGEAALSRLEALDVDLCVAELRLPGMSGIDLIKQIRLTYPDVPVIVTTGYGDIEIATELLKLGVQDFFTKPYSLAAIKKASEVVLQEAHLFTEIRHLRRSLKEFYNFGGMLSKAPAMHELFENIRSVSDTDLTVSVEGETGTGKELVARAIHSFSQRRSRAFIPINCAGIMESLLESELFGYEKGAFTGADHSRPGKVEISNGGTLFLDEIESISLNMQAKLLRVLEDRQVYRLGSYRPIGVDMRVIAASNVRLHDLVAQGRMRQDFFYRIHVISIELIPLRERREDIPLLVQDFLHRHPVAVKRGITRVSERALNRLIAYSWPGNIRELQNTLERAIVREKGKMLRDVALPDTCPGPQLETTQAVGDLPLRQWLREQERRYLTERLSNNKGRIDLTARSCGIGVRTLSRKIHEYRLDKKQLLISN